MDTAFVEFAPQVAHSFGKKDRASRDEIPAFAGITMLFSGGNRVKCRFSISKRRNPVLQLGIIVFMIGALIDVAGAAFGGLPESASIRELQRASQITVAFSSISKWFYPIGGVMVLIGLITQFFGGAPLQETTESSQSALVKCRTCDNKVSTEAQFCPKCGAPNPAVQPADKTESAVQSVDDKDDGEQSISKSEGKGLKAEIKAAWKEVKAEQKAARAKKRSWKDPKAWKDPEVWLIFCIGIGVYILANYFDLF